jgi:hypothetical protein
MAYKKETVQRLSLPSLEKLSEITTAEAESLDKLPPDPYAS